MELEYWNGSKFPPRDWQEKALPRIISHLKMGKNTIVSAIMGAGKSILIAELIWVALHRVQEGQVIIVTAPRQNLVSQLAETISGRVGSEKVGKYYTYEKTIDTPVIVCCNASAMALSAVLKSRAVLLVGDEIHSTESETFKMAFELLAPACAVGFTATPYRSNERESLSIWDDVAYRYEAKDALQDGVIVPWKLIHWDGQGAGNPRQIFDICLYMIKLHCKGPGLVNASNIEQAEAIAYRFREEGYKCKAIHSKLSQSLRQSYLRKLKEGMLDMLVHVNLLTEGVDLPWLRWLCLQRPVAARVRFVQEVGRVLRSHPGKKKAVILDPFDLFGIHGLVYPEALGELLLEEELNPDEERLASLKLEKDDEERIRRMKPAVAFGHIDSWIQGLITAMRAAKLVKPPDNRFHNYRGGNPSAKQLAAIERLKWATRYLPEPIREEFKYLCTPERAYRLKLGTVSDILDIMVGLAEASKPKRQMHLHWKFPSIELPELEAPMPGLVFAASKDIYAQEAREQKEIR